MIPFLLAIYAVLIAALLYCEVKDKPRGIGLFKTLAALGFITLALVGEAHTHIFGQWILAGLVASALGDILLLRKGTGPAFLAGMGAFFLAHLFYLLGFATFGMGPAAFLVMVIFAVIVAILTLRILSPHLNSTLRLGVGPYSFVIALMLGASLWASIQTGNPIFVLAAGLFAISDMAVAQHRFVSGKAWLFWIISPLYFGAQAFFALMAGI